MLELMLFLWIITACIILWEKRHVRMVLWLGLSSFVASIIFFILGSPDVAMAEAAISVFSTIFFIVCLEKYYTLRNPEQKVVSSQKNDSLVSHGLRILFAVFLFGLFMYFSPDTYFDPHLKELYIRRAATDVGGENIVGAIYLGYRVFDTLFEALVLVVAVVAVIHMSHFDETPPKDEKQSEVRKSNVALFLMRIVAPLTIVFGIYLVVNGFLTAGGGFQGGLAIAAFFICRYMVYDIYDISMSKVNKMEEMVFAAISILAVLIVFQEAQALIPYHLLPMFQNIYLIAMNGLVGLKVACGFLILFYRYIAIERS
ncbi:MAG: DUF4040 domain-containing protein [Defluviitaleaceae bacterium]|nr:DUF4040 domain-containing protein [Defluviitaleaceae bacterium]